MNFDRRDFLGTTLSGLGGIALANLLNQDGLLGNQEKENKIPQIDPKKPYAARKGHFKPKAKRVLVIFCAGAVSHLDSFEYKPMLEKWHGKPMPGGDKIITSQGGQGSVMKSGWKFRPRGESGKMISDLFPNIAGLADQLCFIHSLKSKTAAHAPAETYLSTGFSLSGFPSMGSWASWALGTENENLPAFVAIPDPRGKPQASVDNWGSGFLPSTFQGTEFSAAKAVQHLFPPSGISKPQDLKTRRYLEQLNRLHADQHPGDVELSARIASYQLAARMQMSIPDVMDFSKETAATIRSYGIDDTKNITKQKYAKNCLLARRLLEKGVRFVQLFNGAFQTGGEGVSNWDAHSNLLPFYNKHAEIFDQPTAALISDLKQRGLLDDTLVVWCTEFGRMPTIQASKSAGRDHNIHGFTAWMTGAGVKTPMSFGATDEFGHKAVEDVVDIHDFHATILHLLGLDHTRLTFRQNGTQRRLTDVHGNVIEKILS